MSKSLKERYEKELLEAVQKELGFENKFQSPRLVKVVVNVGLGDAAQNAKLLEKGVNELTQITGQKPVVTRAKKSIAGFKIRQGMPVGAMVTLRGERMFDFLNKLVCIVLPRIRDFRGLSEKGFDTRGNFNIGLKDQLVFPEINYDEVDRLRGLNITIVTTAQDDMAAKSLLKHIGFPFRKAGGGEGKEEQNTPAA
jgi:large subunit ribosomal protein L5